LTLVILVDSTGLSENQTVEEGIGGKHPGKPKVEASHQEQTHKAMVGKENHSDSARNPGTVVAVVENSAEIAGFAAVCSNYLLFPLQ
jgi:hypothetical protein